MRASPACLRASADVRMGQAKAKARKPPPR